MPALFTKQDGEVECADSAAPLVSAPIRRLGARDVASLLKEHAQVRGGVTVAEVVGVAERVLGLGSLPCSTSISAKSNMPSASSAERDAITD